MPTFRHRLKSRYAALALVVLSIIGVLVLRLWSMQVLSGGAYASLAEGNRIREITLEAPRGTIVDRNGVPLVTNRVTMAVTVSPTVKDDEMLARLSNVLGVSLDEIREKVDSKKLEALKPRTVAIDVSKEAVAYLAEHETDFPGVEIQQQAVRQYPQGTLAAHVLGYTGEMSEEEFKERPDLAGYQLGDLVGKTGAEREYERALQGDRGYRRFEVDATGRPRKIIEQADPIPGRDVMLTIDVDVQRVAEQALVNALADAKHQKFTKARAGAAVALDLKTGEVLAMASVPTFDPELFIGGISEADWKRLNAKGGEYPLTNRAIMAQYPPASTFKAFTGLAGLTHDVTSPGTTYQCYGRWTEMGEKWPKWCWNHSGHGSETFMEGVKDSCDTVFYEIGYSFYKRKKEELQKFARGFGFGRLTGIDLPSEVDGRVPDAAWKKAFNEDYPEYQGWLPGDTVNIAIGQGDLLVTPLQLTSAYGAIGNGGKVMRPHVLKQVSGSDGKATLVSKPEVSFEPRVSKTDLSTMMRSLVSVTEDGTGRSTFVGFGRRVAGKTGTAQVAGKDDYAWFIGVAPAEKPQYAVGVVIEQGGHGGSVAGPAAREILAVLLGEPVTHVTATDISR